MKKLKKECKEIYSDWEDNEFNSGHNKFIWGIPACSAETASFSTLNCVEVYYNRKYKKFYLNLSGVVGGTFEEEVLFIEKNIKSEFEKFLISISINPKKIDRKEYKQNFLFEEEWLSGYNLEEIYVRLEILLRGLKASCKKNKKN